MIPDPTVEIRSIRDRLAAAFNYDVDLIVDEARCHQAESGLTYINLPPRPVESYWPPNQPLHRSGEAIVTEVVCETSPPGEG